MGIVLVPIPASIVNTIDGIDTKQTSLFFIKEEFLSLSKEHASTPTSIKHFVHVREYNVLIIYLNYYNSYYPINKNDN